MSLEISDKNFLDIYSNFSEISGNLLRIFSALYVLIITICIYCEIGMFLTNNSPDLYTFLCIMFRNNNPFLARLPGISVNSNEDYRRYNFQAFANISGKFLERLNFQKIYNPSLVACIAYTAIAKNQKN